MEHTLELNGEVIEASVTPVDGGYSVRIGDDELKVESVTRIGDLLLLGLNGKTFAFKVTSNRNSVHVANAAFSTASFKRLRAGAHTASEDESSLHAPMAGTVLKVYALKGDIVEKGMRLMILEAMKMEHEILSPISGVVTAVHFVESQRCQQGDTLVEIEVEAQRIPK